MEVGNIAQFIEDKTILITGATGFLAKILVEKILRIQPNVKKLFLLLRATATKSAPQRLHDEIIGIEVFKLLRERWGANLSSLVSDKVIPISGDISFENLGVEDCDLREDIWREIDIIVNSAAATSFDERYDIALGINAFGALHVLNFAKRCSKLQMLLHVSTAFVCGEREGLILEKPFSMGEALNGASGLDMYAEKKLVEETLSELHAKESTQETVRTTMKALGIQRARMYGWPNTYVFTKAMGEMILGEHLKQSLPIVIIRPTIITSTIKEPFPGWIEGFRTMDSIAVAYGKGKLKCFLGDMGSTFDAIPGDMVVNSIMVAMEAHSNKPCEVIYHVGTSLRNPLKYVNLPDYFFRYFSKYPLMNRNGRPVKVIKPTMLGTMARFRFYITIRYLLLLKGLQWVNVVLCQRLQGICVDSNRKINLAMRLGELYKPYIFFKGIFDDFNTEKLRMVARERGVEEDVFYFDPKSIHWDDYFLNIHFPGVVKYVAK